MEIYTIGFTKRKAVDFFETPKVARSESHLEHFVGRRV